MASSYKKNKLLFVILMVFCDVASSTVYLRPESFFFPDAQAQFAATIKSPGLCGALHNAYPLDACNSTSVDTNSLRSPADDDPRLKRFVLIIRGNCSFEEKVRNAQSAGFTAAIVYDDRHNDTLVSMTGNSDGIHIHAVFVSKTAGEFMKKHAGEQQGQCCIYSSVHDRSWTVLLISLFSIITIVSVLTLLYFFRYYCLYHRGFSTRNCTTLDAKTVKNLPTFFFNATTERSGLRGETCAMCLEDYKDGDHLRVLPCQHEFHSSCLDPWLIKWATFCPVCKHKLDTAAPSSKDSNILLKLPADFNIWIQRILLGKETDELNGNWNIAYLRTAGE